MLPVQALYQMRSWWFYSESVVPYLHCVRRQLVCSSCSPNWSENTQTPLLVFMDNRILLDILQKRGKANFNPRPCDIIHFDVIFPLLQVLRQWQYPVPHLKAKSGCLMNERADRLVERGYD